MGKINEDTLEEIRNAIRDIEGSIRSLSYNDISVEVDFGYSVPSDSDVNQEILDDLNESTAREWIYEVEGLQSSVQDLTDTLESLYEEIDGLVYSLREAEEQRDAVTEVEVGDVVTDSDANTATVIAVVPVFGEGQWAWIAPKPIDSETVTAVPRSVPSDDLTVVESKIDREARIARENPSRIS